MSPIAHNGRRLFVKKKRMQCKLDRQVRVWFNGLQNYDLSWSEWKKIEGGLFGKKRKIIRSHAGKDVHDQIFQDKLAMCERCGIKE